MKDTTLGEFIRRTRTQKGMSLRELARQAQVSRAFLSNIELDRLSPSETTLLKIADKLGVSSENLQERNLSSALNEFKQLMERDPALNVAFVALVRDLKRGKADIKNFKKSLSPR